MLSAASDDKSKEKFAKLVGLKDSAALPDAPSDKEPGQADQQKWFETMDQQYEVVRCYFFHFFLEVGLVIFFSFFWKLGYIFAVII